MLPQLEIAVLGALAVALVYLAVRIVFPKKTTPEKRERQRRQLLNKQGRLGEAFITEVNDQMIHYTYSVNTVRYTAAQDVSTLTDFLPEGHERLIGVANIKYMPKNPANSILLCEDWNGLREMPGRHMLANSNAVGHQA